MRRLRHAVLALGTAVALTGMMALLGALPAGAAGGPQVTAGATGDGAARAGWTLGGGASAGWAPAGAVRAGSSPPRPAITASRWPTQRTCSACGR